jgi:hypothetical protein
MNKIIVLVNVLTFSLALFQSCGTSKNVTDNADKVVESTCKSNVAVTYTTVKTIIDSECAGCHGEGSAETIGDFRNYAGLKSYLESGRFTKLVLVKHSMPKGGELSQANLDLLNCWKEGGFKE